MHILLQILLLIVGFVCLVKGADIFVGGSSALARKFNVPGLIIGLTIVALGTSAPEMAVSTVTAIQGSNEIAISNVVGSNIFNLLFILGISALIHPVLINMASVYDLMILVVVSVISYIFAFTSRRIARGEGILMLMIYVTDVVFAILR